VIGIERMAQTEQQRDRQRHEGLTRSQGRDLFVEPKHMAHLDEPDDQVASSAWRSWRFFLARAGLKLIPRCTDDIS
jgi:hypothetical protein